MDLIFKDLLIIELIKLEKEMNILISHGHITKVE
jgi:hypothetical protein